MRGPFELIFPIARQARHQNPSGSREAIKWFTEFLEASPRDLRIIWLLNIAYMTLGEHPDRVPPQYLLPAGLFRSKAEVAPLRMWRSRPDWVCGGPIWPAAAFSMILTETIGPTSSPLRSMPNSAATLLINRGDGTFADRSSPAGLPEQVYALNVTAR